MHWRPYALCVALVGGCAHAPPSGPVRFVNRAPVERVNDRVNVPNKPADQPFAPQLYSFDGLVTDALTVGLELRKTVRATNVNSVDEVPDSTWFQNRIGVRDLSVDEVRNGPTSSQGPAENLPWTIVSSKVGGASVGFIIKDSTGQKYILKFDQRGGAEMETGAHVIVHRILWACGYNVPEDEIVYFERDQLLLGENAVIKDPFGNKQPMTERDVDARLRLISSEPGKPIRGLVSRYIDGIPIGGFSSVGTRDDDPNDTVPHQHRRELRGLQPIAAWLAHSDVKEGNTLDAWAPDPENPDHHYVVHYLIDFGKALGVMATAHNWDGSAFAYVVDWKWFFRSAVSLGLWPRPWDGIETDQPRGIGLFESSKYDPGEFRPGVPYAPFEEMDRLDGFWGAKILMRFSREQLQAVVEEAKYSDPEATKYMVETLVARQRKTARYWFRRVAPLDRFRLTDEADDTELCFDDLMLEYGLERASTSVQYRVRTYDHGGKPTGSTRTIAGATSACAPAVRPGPTHEGDVIVRIDRTAGKRSTPPVYVHLALAADGDLQVIGVWRQ